MLKIDSQPQHFVSRQVFCDLPYTKVILTSFGEVSMCCHQAIQIGKLTKEVGVLDIWDSPLAKEIRSESDKNQLHRICKSGNSCPFLTRERVMRPRSVYRSCAYPLYLEICLPDKHCNVGGEEPNAEHPACMMCKRNFEAPRQPDLTDFLCEKAKPLMPYLRYLCVMGIAEPFWKDATFHVLDKLDFHIYKDRIEYTTNTNGILLNERTAKRFFEMVAMSDISWSLDAASRHVHQTLRRLDTFDLVVENLRRWIQLREHYGGREKHKVSIYNNINLLNVHEMSAMVDQAKDIGVDQLIMLPTYDQSGIVKLGELMLCDKNVKIFKKASEQAMSRATEIGLSLVYSKSFDLAPTQADDCSQLVQIV